MGRNPSNRQMPSVRDEDVEACEVGDGLGDQGFGGGGIGDIARDEEGGDFGGGLRTPGGCSHYDSEFKGGEGFVAQKGDEFAIGSCATVVVRRGES